MVSLVPDRFNPVQVLAREMLPAIAMSALSRLEFHRLEDGIVIWRYVDMYNTPIAEGKFSRVALEWISEMFPLE